MNNLKQIHNFFESLSIGYSNIIVPLCLLQPILQNFCPSLRIETYIYWYIDYDIETKVFKINILRPYVYIVIEKDKFLDFLRSHIKFLCA